MKKLSTLFTFLIIFVFIGLTQALSVTQLEIHFIDVGQADSIYFVLPDGKNMLIDGGNNADGSLVVNYLKNHGVTRLDYVIGTHPHEDHIGGLDDVINSFDIGKVYLPNINYTSQTYTDVLNAVAAKNLTVTTAKAGVALFNTTANNLTLKADIISPVSSTYAETNDYSAVVKLIYGNTKYMLTGDAGILPESEMINSGVDLKADVLKVGHHGSNTSTSQAFLDAVKPTSGIISVGTGNTYGHPTQETLDKLAAANVTVYRTDYLGTILLTSNGSSITINGNTTNPEPPVVTDPAPTPTASLYINEVLPAPTTGNQEWVEIYNPGSTSVDISGYILDDIANGGSAPVTIPNGTIIAAKGYYVYYFGSVLNNSGDDVRLLKPDQTVVDSYTYGSSAYDMSWYRETDGGNWSATQTDAPTPSASNSGAVTPTLSVVINEVLPAPSKTYKQEWVELYNPTNSAIDISGYQIDDIEGGSTPYVIPQGTTISAKGYYVVYFSSVFNNTGDDVRLFNNSGVLIDSLTYTSSQADKSWYRYPDGGDWSTTVDGTPTPKAINS